MHYEQYALKGAEFFSQNFMHYALMRYNHSYCTEY